MKKLLALVVILVLLALLAWKIYSEVSSSGTGFGRNSRGAAVAVEAVKVEKNTIRDIGFFTGSLLPSTQFVIAPKISGRLNKLMVNIGDHVQRDQLIAVLDDEEYKQQVEQGQAGLVASKAYLEKAKRSLLLAQQELVTDERRVKAGLEAAKARHKDAMAKSERQKQLLEKKLVSEEEYETAQTAVIEAFATLETAKMQLEELDTDEKALELKRQDVTLAQADIAQKESALKTAQVRLSYAKIHASWEEGSERRVVGEKFVDAGALLAPNTPIVSILDIEKLIALIYVIERDYQKISIGQEASIATDALPGKSFKGRIARVAPVLKETSRQARVEIEVPNSDELLKPGMFVRVQIQFEEHRDVPLVPLTSLARRDDREGVFMIDPVGKKASFTPVELGITDRKFAEIVAPPLAGLVVTVGHHLLEDGSAVIVAETDSVREPSPNNAKDEKTFLEEPNLGGEK